MKNTYLECGKIIAPHGVRGAFKAESWCDTPKVLASQKRVFLNIGDTMREHKVITSSVSGDLVIMTVEGVSDREAAQALKNRVLYLDRGDIDLKPGQYFITDLMGLPCVDADTGKVYGKIEDITDGVRYRLYHIRTENGLVVYPALPQFVKEVDPRVGLMITPIEGFFEK